MGEYVKVATVDQLQPERGLPVEVMGKRIAIFKVGEQLYAIDDMCTHVGAPLAEGTIVGTAVICPWHGAHFSLTTGRETPPARGPVCTYPVRVKGSDIEVEIAVAV